MKESKKYKDVQFDDGHRAPFNDGRVRWGGTRDTRRGIHRKSIGLECEYTEVNKEATCDSICDES